jgi:hypothetical protein
VCHPAFVPCAVSPTRVRVAKSPLAVPPFLARESTAASIARSKCEKVIPKGGRGFWGGRAVSPLRNLGSYAWGAAGADKLIGHPDQLDVVVLGDPAHHVEGLVGVDFVAFHQDALSLPDDGSV